MQKAFNDDVCGTCSPLDWTCFCSWQISWWHYRTLKTVTSLPSAGQIQLLIIINVIIFCPFLLTVSVLHLQFVVHVNTQMFVILHHHSFQGRNDVQPFLVFIKSNNMFFLSITDTAHNNRSVYLWRRQESDMDWKSQVYRVKRHSESSVPCCAADHPARHKTFSLTNCGLFDRQSVIQAILEAFTCVF